MAKATKKATTRKLTVKATYEKDTSGNPGYHRYVMDKFPEDMILSTNPKNGQGYVYIRRDADVPSVITATFNLTSK